MKISIPKSSLKMLVDKITGDTYWSLETPLGMGFGGASNLRSAIKSLSLAGGHIDGQPIATFLASRAFYSYRLYDVRLLNSIAFNSLRDCTRLDINSGVIRVLEGVLREGIHCGGIAEHEYLTEMACAIVREIFESRKMPRDITRALVLLVKSGPFRSKIEAARALSSADRDSTRKLIYDLLEKTLGIRGPWRFDIGLLAASKIILQHFSDTSMFPNLVEAIESIEKDKDFQIIWTTIHISSDDSHVVEPPIAVWEQNSLVLSRLLHSKPHSETASALRAAYRSDPFDPSPVRDRIKEIVGERIREIWLNLLHSEELRLLLVSYEIEDQQNIFLLAILTKKILSGDFLTPIDKDPNFLTLCLCLIRGGTRVGFSKEMLKVLETVIAEKWDEHETIQIVNTINEIGPSAATSKIINFLSQLLRSDNVGAVSSAIVAANKLKCWDKIPDASMLLGLFLVSENWDIRSCVVDAFVEQYRVFKQDGKYLVRQISELSEL